MEFVNNLGEPIEHNESVVDFRHEFDYPLCSTLPNVDQSLVSPEEQCVYLTGHSLGLKPKNVTRHVEREMKKWSDSGVHGHFSGEMPWALCDEVLLSKCAKLIGSHPDEIGIMNSLTVNLNLLLISFYCPTKERHKLLIEDHAFPSDQFAAESIISLKGFDPSKSLIRVKPRKGEYLIRDEDLYRILEDEGDSILLVLLPGVQYYTGQLFDMQRITELAHAKGCHVGFDLAHAIGNVVIELHDWLVDFAVWCSYKYLNAGAGGIGGAFLHSRHRYTKLPKLHGWWSNSFETRFTMNNKLQESAGISAYRVSNPSPFLCAMLEASLDIFERAPVFLLRKKSIKIVAYLEKMIEDWLESESGNIPEPILKSFRIITPKEANRRGNQLTMLFPGYADQIFAELEKRAVIVDLRRPDALRFSMAPLYNNKFDADRFIVRLKASVHAALIRQ